MYAIPLEISNFFLAMQAGKAGAANLEAAFAKDAEYQEPFSGEMRTHRGRAEIIAAMAMGWETPMNDMQIRVKQAVVSGDEIVVDWVCQSPSLPGGEGHGQNHYTMHDGLIQKLVTNLTA